MRRLAVALLIVMGTAAWADAESAIPVSLINLIATPDQFEGKLVLVEGFASFEFEGSALYLTSEDYTHQLYRNAIWLTVTSLSEVELKALDRRFVSVEGRFRSTDRGHGDLYAASVEVTKIVRRGPYRQLLKEE